jgi:hypothetical protein
VTWWRLALAMVVSLLGTWGAERPIAWLLIRWRAGGATQARERDVWGRRIGRLERVLVILLAVPAGLGAVPWVLAAKSLARFRDLDDRAFAEYYLAGTLLSMTVAAACVLVIRALLGVSP